MSTSALADASPPGGTEPDWRRVWADLLASDRAVGTLVHDAGTDRLDADAAARRLLGLAAPPAALAWRDLEACVPPADAAALRAALNDDPAAGERTLTPSERSDTVRLRWHRLAPHAGAPAGALALTVLGDAPAPAVTRATRVDTAARRFELITRTAGIGYWTLEAGAERAEWGAALRDLHGLAADAPVPSFGEWIQRGVHEGDRHEVRRSFGDWARAGHPGSLALAFRVLRPDGSVRHVITQTQREPHGATPSLMGVVVDVTGRVMAEQALQSARERVALATRGVGLGTWELAFDSAEAVWDEQMWLLRGLPPRSAAMTPEERLACVHPEDRDRVAALGVAAFEGDALLEHEFRVVWPDGQVRWIASRSTVLRDGDGRAQRRIGVNWDVTEARRAAEARRESLAKSAFLARMSHELRTPLNAVLGFAQLLRADETGTDAEAARRLDRLDQIRGAGQHLLELINDVLDLARVQGGELRVEREPIALAPLVTEAAALVERGAAARGIGLVLDGVCAGPPLRVLADPTRLRQVLINLLSNAVKVNRDGGRVEVSARAAGDQVAIEVADTGHGFDEAQRSQLFEPFNRLGLDSGPIEGTGIGLSIVKALVEHMGGRVEAESRPGHGSVFRVWLPAAPDDSVPAAARERPVSSATVGTVADNVTAASADTATGAARRQRLLYIEDNAINALLIRELVARRADIELRIAATGLAGVREAQAWRPQLVLLDMQLPDIDGFEVLRRLRADPATTGMPVVALSANAMPQDIRAALASGLDDYWTKPLDFALFLDRLQRWFGPAPT